MCSILYTPCICSGGTGSPTSAVIKRAELDGLDLTTIVNSDEAGNPRDLVIDYQGELL